MNPIKKRKILKVCSVVLIFLTIITAFFSIVNLWFNFIYEKNYVRGYSMQPTLNYNVLDATQDGDQIYIKKTSNVKLNDILVANPNWYEKKIVKRLVATPGDTLEIRELEDVYELYINGEILYTKSKSSNINIASYYELYITYINNPEHNIVTLENGNKAIKMRENEYFLMGDNWGSTTDSLSYSPVTLDQIVGRVDLVIPYKSNNKVGLVIDFIFKNMFRFN